MLSDNEKQVLRELAGRLMEIAALPEQKERIALWLSLNRGQMQRPMVAIAQLPWHEMDFDGSLTCVVGDPFWREVETEMRRQLYRWAHIRTDMVIEPFIDIPMSVSGINYGLDVIEKSRVIDETNDVYSHQYVEQIKDYDDIGKIHDMRVIHDAETTKAHMEQAAELFDGVAPVRPKGVQFSLSVWDRLSTFIGVQNIYYFVADRPEFLTRCVDHITDATIAGIKRADELGVYDNFANICHCSYIYTDDLLPGPNMPQKSGIAGSWAFGMAQLFSSVSPATFRDFELPYIKKMAAMFGSIYYGCCEPLDDRLDLVKQIPNVRKVSCSPWNNSDKFAERIGPKLTMSVKPNPAILASGGFDDAQARAELGKYIASAKRYDVNLEFIMKDVSTVSYKPECISRWTDIAKEMVCA